MVAPCCRPAVPPSFLLPPVPSPGKERTSPNPCPQAVLRATGLQGYGTAAPATAYPSSLRDLQGSGSCRTRGLPESWGREKSCPPNHTPCPPPSSVKGPGPRSGRRRPTDSLLCTSCFTNTDLTVGGRPVGQGRAPHFIEGASLLPGLHSLEFRPQLVRFPSLAPHPEAQVVVLAGEAAPASTISSYVT